MMTSLGLTLSGVGLMDLTYGRG